MRTYLLLALVSILVTSCGNSNAQEERSQNAIEFDSLISIITKDQEYVDQIYSQLETDSARTYWDDLLNLEFEEIVEKNDMDSTDQRYFLQALSVTAQIAEMNLKLKNNFDNSGTDDKFAEIESMFAELEAENEKDSIIETIMDSIWYCDKVQSFLVDIGENSEDSVQFAIYRDSKESFEKIIIVQMLDETTKYGARKSKTLLTFRTIPEEDWNIEYYDSEKKRYIKFEKWKNSK
jgi:hypothetical protein